MTVLQNRVRTHSLSHTHIHTHLTWPKVETEFCHCGGCRRKKRNLNLIKSLLFSFSVLTTVFCFLCLFVCVLQLWLLFLYFYYYGNDDHHNLAAVSVRSNSRCVCVTLLFRLFYALHFYFCPVSLLLVVVVINLTAPLNGCRKKASRDADNVFCWEKNGRWKAATAATAFKFTVFN